MKHVAAFAAGVVGGALAGTLVSLGVVQNAPTTMTDLRWRWHRWRLETGRDGLTLISAGLTPT